ncbi:MAG: AAA family ATPase [Candidatus Micrarchaeia archaeon]
MNVFRNQSTENRIFRNEEVFRPDYLPDEILHREQEIRDIVFAVKALEEQRKQPSVMIYGPPGTGKTCTAKYVMKEFSEYTQRAKVIYVNCWQNNTRYAIISKIAQGMDALVPSTGIGVDELFMRIRESVEKLKQVPLVVLDEVDILQKKKEDEVLYDLLRMQEIYGIAIGLVLITNDVSFVAGLDKRIRSSLAQNAVEFASYGPQQIRDILKERAKMGFQPGTWDDELISACAGFAGKNNGDSRIGIALLWMAGKEAEKANKKKIDNEDLESAKKKVGLSLRGDKEDELKEDETKLLELLKNGKQGGMTSGEIYEKAGINERTVRNYLSHLESIGLIESEDKKLDSGRTRIFRMKKL